jgi:hypothetical protein
MISLTNIGPSEDTPSAQEFLSRFGLVPAP